MANKKAGSKLYLFFGLIFILTMLTVIYIVEVRTNNIINDLTFNRVLTANHSFVNYISELEERVTMRAEVMSGSESIVTAMKNKDYTSLQRYLLTFAYGFDFSAICDPQGIVVARSHSTMLGDNISGYKGVGKTLRTGLVSTSIEVIVSNNSRLSIYASAPIYDRENLIGIVNFCYDLTQNDYVDSFKERTGCEATIFMNDIRISTTLRDESGYRIVGTSARDYIVESVIGYKENYHGYLDIYGKTYGVYYSPLLNDGEAIGMLFTGVDIDLILKNRRSMNLWIITAYLIGISMSIAYTIISNFIARKYVRFSEKQLSQQLLMADISRSFLSDSDIDVLITNTLKMVGEFLNCPQVLLFDLSDDGSIITCRHEYINPKLNLTSRIGGLMPLKEPALSIIKNLKPESGNDICLRSDNPVIREAFAPYRVSFNNYITTPVFLKGEMSALIDFSGYDDYKWTEGDISLAALFASTLSGVLEREAMGQRTSIVEKSPNLIFYADTEGNLAYANPAVSVVTGYTSAELRTGGFKLIVDEKSDYSFEDAFNSQSMQKGLVTHECIIKCKDGRRRLLELTSFLLKDGTPAAIGNDLTEKRELESEIIHAKERAEHASNAKGEFLSTMSHEMRTPMNAIIGMTMIAKNTDDNERKKYALEKIENASTHLLGIINNVLDMSKIEANKLELNFVEFELRELLQKVFALINFRLEEKNLKYSLNVDNNVPFFFIGADQHLTQIIINLLSNAVKFTPEGGSISVSVNLIGVENNLVELGFEVKDSGIGISLEQQEKIFNIFEQAETGITRKYGGTGLGLAISKRIIELMGGTIRVESEPGKGSKFIFSVKLQRGITNADSNTDSNSYNGESEITAEEMEGVFPNRNILLAEDIEINREILISLLSDTGLIIDTAENGLEALNKIKESPDLYELVLMDMQMPEMNGLEATQRIREFESTLDNKSHRRIPIIAMTANVFKDDIDNCLAAGMDDHIGKPLDINIVMQKLRKHMKIII